MIENGADKWHEKEATNPKPKQLQAGRLRTGPQPLQPGVWGQQSNSILEQRCRRHSKDTSGEYKQRTSESELTPFVNEKSHTDAPTHLLRY